MSDIGKGDTVEYLGGLSDTCKWPCRCRCTWAPGQRFVVEECRTHPYSGKPGISFVGARAGNHRFVSPRHFKKIGPARDIQRWLAQPTKFEGPVNRKVRA